MDLLRCSKCKTRMFPGPGALGPTCDQIIRGKVCDGLPERFASIPDQITFARPGVHRASDGKTYTITYEKGES